jgi:hypothetical protein
MREIEPTIITQGEQLQWTRDYRDYPASEWTLQYRFRGPGPGFDESATADGHKFVVAVSTTKTANMSTGRYQWQAWATEIADPTNKVNVGTGFTKVNRGFIADATGNIDLRSDAKIALDAINAAIQNKATNDQMEYEITTPAGSRKIRRVPLVDLLSARKEYATIVSRENAAERARVTGQFGRPVVINVRENG